MKWENLLKLAGKPPVFSPGDSCMWSDPHISKHMLEAHLDSTLDAASRRSDTIRLSLEWLYKKVLPPPPAKILDLGCGPGLYALPLARKGYEVWGVDISPRSISYAREKAKEENLKIQYMEMDYLEMKWEEFFDAVLLIYCDFGALIRSERDKVLGNIYRALKPGGKFIFDIFTPNRRGADAEGRDWMIAEEGFWSAKPHLVLSETFFYKHEDVFLEQYLVLEEKKNPKVYRVWDHFYSRKSIIPVLENLGFEQHQFFSDITGKKYNSGSETLALITKKAK